MDYSTPGFPVHHQLLEPTQTHVHWVGDAIQPSNARLPCPSLSPEACSNSCPFNQWCHPTISSSVVPFSSCLQTFPASGSFSLRYNRQIKRKRYLKCTSWQFDKHTHWERIPPIKLISTLKSFSLISPNMTLLAMCLIWNFSYSLIDPTLSPTSLTITF